MSDLLDGRRQRIKFPIDGGAAINKYDPAAIHHATSHDGRHWSRASRNPIVRHSPIVEDLCVTRVGPEWVMYVTTFVPPEPGGPKRSTIVRHRSSDLVRWSVWQLVGTGVDENNAFSLGDLQLFRRGVFWYLVSRGSKTFRGRTRYCFSEVWWSRDPFRFDFKADYAGLLDVWGSVPIFRDFDGGWYTMHCYYHSRGLWLVPLRFFDGQDDAETSIPLPRPA